MKQQILNCKFADLCRSGKYCIALLLIYYYLFLVQPDLFAFLRPVGKGRTMGVFTGAECGVWCAFWTPEKQLLVCCLDVFTGRAGIDPSESSTPRGRSLFWFGQRCQLNVITNKFILIEYVNELWSLLSAELAKYIGEEVSVLSIPSSLILNP